MRLKGQLLDGLISRISTSQFLNTVAVAIVVGAVTELISFQSAQQRYIWHQEAKSIRSWQNFVAAARIVRLS